MRFCQRASRLRQRRGGCVQEAGSARRRRKTRSCCWCIVSAVLTLAYCGSLSLFGISGRPLGLSRWPSAVILWCTGPVLRTSRRRSPRAGARRRRTPCGPPSATWSRIKHQRGPWWRKGSRRGLTRPASSLAQAEEVILCRLEKKDLFFVRAEEQIPADGEVIVMGAASRWTSAPSPERSAPVIREAGGDRCSAVTGGTDTLSDLAGGAGDRRGRSASFLGPDDRHGGRRRPARRRRTSWRSRSC